MNRNIRYSLKISRRKYPKDKNSMNVLATQIRNGYLLITNLLLVGYIYD